MKLNAKQWKWISILAVLLVFTVGTYITTADQEGKLTNTYRSEPKRKAKPVDMEDLPVNWKEVDSYKQVNEFYERHLPHIQLARELGVTKYPRQSLPIEGLDGRIQLNEVWHSGQVIHYLYSVDLSLLVEDKETKEITGYHPNVFEVKEVYVYGEGDLKNQTLHTFSSMHPSQAVVFENRLYGVMQSTPITKNGLRDFWSVLDQPFNQTLDTTMRFVINGKSYETERFPVHYSYQPEEQTLKTFTFNGSYEKDGVTIRPLKVELNLTRNFVELEITSRKANLGGSMEAEIRSPSGHFFNVGSYLQKVEGKENTFRLYFPPLPEVPEKLTLDVKSLHLEKDTSISFEVDIPDEEKNLRSLNKKIAEVNNTEIYLKEKRYHKYSGLDLVLSFMPKDPTKQHIVGIGRSYSPFAQNDQNTIQFKTDEGVSGKPGYGGPPESTHINVQEARLEGAHTVTFTLNKVLYSEGIDHKFQTN